MSQSTAFVVSTKAWCQRVGDEFLLRSACGDHAAVSLAGQTRRLHPTRIRTRTARPRRDGGGSGVATRPVPILIRTRDHGHSRRLAHPRRDVPFVAARVVGQTSRSRPRWRGGGERVSATHPRRSSSSRRLCRADSWTGRKTVARFTPPRPSSPPGVSVTHSHRVFSSKGLLFSAIRQGKDRRPIPATGCPRHHLQRTPRTRSDNALSLAVHV